MSAVVGGWCGGQVGPRGSLLRARQWNRASLPRRPRALNKVRLAPVSTKSGHCPKRPAS
ncbi:hypothetical protein ALSL_0768 [Aerosticca soli]|uniref:Uncharacterized protein n=1 Tax=Aerosticca soli TaxID=2010829 RepID=A0A2Z6E3S3_9GAMM|nr:hypothetical protein ALSL_0768 [Aerosticca soli]